MSIDSIDAVQRLNDYLSPSQRRYFKTKADLLGYYEGGVLLFGSEVEPYDIILSVQTNYITINIPSFQDFGYYFSFSTSYQKIAFDDNKNILTIRGDKSKSGKKYKVKLRFNTDLYDIED